MIKNLFSNIISLLKLMCKGKVSWKPIAIRMQGCDINQKTKIYEPYNLIDVQVGYGTYISENSRISKTSIGKFSSIGPNFLCGYGIHPIDGLSTSPVFYSVKNQVGFTLSKTDKVVERKEIKIGNDVFIGSNVTVLDGIIIGDGAVIGAGAVVSKDIPPYAIAVGCPIKIIRYRFDQESIDKLLRLKWWDKDENEYKKVEENFWNINSYLDQNKL